MKRTCKKCGVEKDIEKFRKVKTCCYGRSYLCQSCQTKYQKKKIKELRDKRKKNNLCRDCGEPALYGKTLCKKCQEKYRERNNAQMNRYKEKNLCTSCGKPNFTRFVLCEHCKEKHRKDAEIARNKKIKNNLCPCCSKVNFTGNYYCELCQKKKTVRQRELENCICHSDGCNNRVVYQHNYCQSCLDIGLNKGKKIRGGCNVFFIDCKICGKLFTNIHPHWSMCSECRSIRKSNKVFFIKCDVCGNLFTASQSDQKRCSDKCKKAGKWNTHKSSYGYAEELIKRGTILKRINIPQSLVNYKREQLKLHRAAKEQES